jgi:hypothetical protein
MGWVFATAVLWLLGQGLFILVDIARRGWEKPDPVVTLTRDPTWDELNGWVRQAIDLSQGTVPNCADPEHQGKPQAASMAVVTFYCSTHDPYEPEEEEKVAG